MPWHRPNLRAALVLGLSAILAACDGSDPSAPGTPDSAALTVQMEAFVSAMNAHRLSVGCPELAWNAEVARVAEAHSQDMLDREYFSHTSPDGDSPFDRLAEAGISYTSAAENLAYGFSTGTAVLEAWLDSPGHRANIENCALTQHGVGLEGTYWTHLFIRP